MWVADSNQWRVLLPAPLQAIWARIQELAAAMRKGLRDVEGVDVLDKGRTLCGIVSFTKAGTTAPNRQHQQIPYHCTDLTACPPLQYSIPPPSHPRPPQLMSASHGAMIPPVILLSPLLCKSSPPGWRPPRENKADAVFWRRQCLRVHAKINPPGADYLRPIICCFCCSFGFPNWQYHVHPLHCCCRHLPQQMARNQQ